MAIEGLQAVQARVSEIQGRMARLHAAAPRAGSNVQGWGTGLAGAGTSTSPGSFSEAFQAAVTGTSATGVRTAGTVGTTATTGLRPAVVKAPGQYPRLEPPAELARYGNGKIPASALTPIGVGQHRLAGQAAGAYTAMVDAAARDGVTIGITDSYRSYDQQVDLAQRKGLYGQGGWAAVPGRSNHGWGMAVDVDVDAAGQAWLRDNGWRFGWVESVPREPWHWEFRPAS